MNILLNNNMDNQIFKIKKSDTFPSLTISVGTKGSLGQKIGLNLSGVSAVTFSMTDECSNLKTFNQPCEIVCSSGGTIQYNWKPEDTNTHGSYLGEFKLNFTSGGTLTIPTIGGIKIKVLDSINKF